MSIADKLTDLTVDLRNCRTAITNKGGTISATAGFAEVAEQIALLPTGSNVGTVIDDSTALVKTVPVNSISHCYINSIGGMTYKCNQLIPFPYKETSKTINGVTFTVNDDGTVTINGTATADVIFSLYGGDNFLLSDKVYTFSGVPSGANEDTYYMHVLIYYEDEYGDVIASTNTPVTEANPDSTITPNTDDKEAYFDIRIKSGTTVNNVVFKPMLNEGSTALPYEPYYEGLRDAKCTALKVTNANGESITYPLPEEILTLTDGKGVKGYYDTMDFENDKFDKKCAALVLVGTETWYIYQVEGVNQFYFNIKTGDGIALPIPRVVPISNFFKGISIDDRKNNYETIFTTTGGFAVNTLLCTTIDEWKAYLAEQYANGNPVTVTYAVAEPTEIDLPVGFSPLLPVEEGGTIEFVNEHSYAVPSKITYQTVVGG